jgi:hypothetical protein
MIMRCGDDMENEIHLKTEYDKTKHIDYKKLCDKYFYKENKRFIHDLSLSWVGCFDRSLLLIHYKLDRLNPKIDKNKQLDYEVYFYSIEGSMNDYVLMLKTFERVKRLIEKEMRE